MTDALDSPKKLTLGVVLTTYRRLSYLKKCLDALLAQVRKPEQIIVVFRPEDRDTAAYLAAFALEHPIVLPCEVLHPGVIQSLNRGLYEMHTDIAVFTDDDAEPDVAWLERIEAAFLSDDAIGAVGGRDTPCKKGEPLPTEAVTRVGVIGGLGDLIGNHHQPYHPPEPRFVDFLKTVNMAFRRALMPATLDTRLLGSSSHYEIDLCLGIKHQGYKILFDPAITVRHDIDAPFYEMPLVHDLAIVRDRLSAFLHNRMLVLGKHFNGFYGWWLFAIHFAWFLPKHVWQQKQNLPAVISDAPLLYRAALQGWLTGRDKLPENILLLNASDKPDRNPSPKRAKH